MATNRLLDLLCEISADFNAWVVGLGAWRDWKDDELPDGRFGPLQPTDEFVEEQRKRLEAIDEIVRKAVAEVFGDSANSILVFVTGSIAKLEYLKGVSDLDFLGVITEGKRLPLFEEAEKFKQLESLIKKRSAAWSGIPDEDMKISGMPIMRTKRDKPEEIERAKAFYGESELIDNVGQEFESPWAVFERASLLFESAMLSGDSETGKKIREQIDTLYHLTTDLSTGRFPLVAYCLAQFLAKSGILAKAAKVRKSAEKPLLMSKESAKTVISRIWTSNLNLVAMHVFYWDYSIGERGKASGDLLESFRQPPIWKAMRVIPFHIEFILKEEECKLRLQKILGPDTKAVESLYRRLSAIHIQLRANCSDGVVPLWYRFLQLMRLAREIRGEKAELDSSVIERIKLWNSELENILSECAAITRTLCFSKVGDGLTDFHDLIADNIHGVGK